MKIALYDENISEQQLIIAQLHQCGQEHQRLIEIISFCEYTEFCNKAKDYSNNFDIFIIAQDGTVSIEALEFLKDFRPKAKIVWFSDLDFAIRSYVYGTMWFSQKPISLNIMRKVFDRVLSCRGHPYC